MNNFVRILMEPKVVDACYFNWVIPAGRSIPFPMRGYIGLVRRKKALVYLEERLTMLENQERNGENCIQHHLFVSHDD